MARFIATFRVLLIQEIEAPDAGVAMQIGEKIGSKLFQTQPDFKFVELAKVEEKEI